MRLLSSEILTHSKSPNACFVIFGWNKNKVHTIEIIMYLFKFRNLVGHIRCKTVHSKTKIMISKIGNSMVRNVLNISLEGAKNLVSLCLMNQSNDKKASDGEPTISTDPNIWTKLSGNFKFNE